MIIDKLISGETRYFFPKLNREVQFKSYIFISSQVFGSVEKQQALLKKLGKHKTGKGCLYINKLEEVDMTVLKQIITKGLVK